MGLNRTAKGIVLVPTLLLGGAFLAAATWGEAAGANRTLAFCIGAVLMGAGLLAQMFPEADPERRHSKTGEGDQPKPERRSGS